jgi:stage V sporulation protein SpoVS
MSETKILKVASSTSVQKLSNSIVSCYEENPETVIVLRAIGAGAVNQAVKAAINSNHYFSRKGFMVTIVPSFKNFSEGEEGNDRKTCSIEMRIDLKRI